MKRKLAYVAIIFSIAILFSACGGKQSYTQNNTSTQNENMERYDENSLVSKNSESVLKGTYTVLVNGYDWGPSVNRVIMQFERKIDSVTKDDFSVEEVKTVTDYTQEDTPAIVDSFKRRISNAYLSDENGIPVTGASNYVTLDLYVSPEEGSPINYNPESGLNTWCDTYALYIDALSSSSITSDGIKVHEIDVDTRMNAMITSVDNVATDTFTSTDRITYQYAHYEPANGSETLIVWLHGDGEGGIKNTDPRIPMLACKSAVLLNDNFQATVGGANILIPQCPTIWMDMNGGGRTSDILTANDGTSFFTSSLKELIDFYRDETGSKKIILAGCSNGGFMALVLALSNPDEYDMIIPICETLQDDTVSDSQLTAISDIPMFFIYSQDDSVAVPATYSLATIERLRSIGASNLNVCAMDSVVGYIETESGSTEEYRYSGHWSWILFFNNQAVSDSNGKKVWDILAGTAKG